MIPGDILLLFFAASVALALAPGPDNIFVLTQSVLQGRRAGVCVTLGLCTGLLGHIAAVALGVAALLKTSALAFAVLQAVGAAYLLYLAWQSFRAGRAQIDGPAGAGLSARALYGRGIVMNLSNPKVAIFFLAFLPQFTDPARGAVVGQLIVLGLVFMLAALLVFCAIAWAASRIGAWLRRSPRLMLGMHRLAGVVFVLLAGRLLLAAP